MKKSILVIVVCLFGLNVFSQEKFTSNDLIGYWKPNKESSHLFFWKNSIGKLQTQEICGTSGSPIDAISLRIEKDYIFIRTILLENGWVTESVYTFINKNTLKCVITGDGNDTVIYTKVK
jgi:hypothetical protein